MCARLSSSSAKRARGPHQGLPAVTHTAFGLVLPFLEMHTDMRAVQCCSSELRAMITDHLLKQTEVLLDGRAAPLVFSSPEALMKLLVTKFSPHKILRIQILSARMRLPEISAENARLEYESIESDGRAPTFPLPLDILPRFKNLNVLTVESSSSLDHMIGILHAGAKAWCYDHGSAPIQLGLANLHELAGNCPKLEALRCYHVERDSNGMVSDLWGPDATLRVCKKLRSGCPLLKDLGLLSSPGPRILQELRRMGISARTPLGISRDSEAHETFMSSFLTELNSFAGDIRITVVFSSSSAPGASARSSVLYFMQEMQPLAADAFRGEYDDFVKLAPTFPASTKLTPVVRTSLLRIPGEFNVGAAYEAVECAKFSSTLAKENIETVKVPADVASLLEDDLAYADIIVPKPRRFQTASCLSFADLLRSTSFTVQARLEPGDRSMTVGSQDSRIGALPISRQVSQRTSNYIAEDEPDEPDDLPGELLPDSFLFGAMSMNEALLGNDELDDNGEADDDDLEDEDDEFDPFDHHA